MAKFASIITLLFITLVLFTAFEAPTMVAAMDFGNNPEEDPTQDCLDPTADCGTGESEGNKMCRSYNEALPGVCKSNTNCKRQCMSKGAGHGSCNRKRKCTCYFKC